MFSVISCPECKKDAVVHIIKIFVDLHDKIIFITDKSMGHCINAECSITYFTVKDIE